MSGFEEFADQFARISTQACYILTDHAVSFSGNGMVGKMAAFMPDAILVGAPTGQPANCWGNAIFGRYIVTGNVSHINDKTQLRMKLNWVLVCNFPLSKIINQYNT